MQFKALNTYYETEITLELAKNIKKEQKKIKKLLLTIENINSKKNIKKIFKHFGNIKYKFKNQVGYSSDLLLNLNIDYMNKKETFNYLNSIYKFNKKLLKMMKKEFQNSIELHFNFYTYIGDRNHKLLQNAIQTPDGTYLISTHTHDFKTYRDKKTNKEYILDGGLEYVKTDINKDKKDLSIYTYETFKEIRKKFLWGTSGKSGNEKLKWLILKNMTTSHIKAILQNVKHIKGTNTEEILKAELIYRKWEKI